MNSTELRNDPLFLRNSFDSLDKWGIPMVKKQTPPSGDLRLIACSDTRRNDNDANRKRGVHFFVDDFRFEGIYRQPERTLKKYAQYAFLLTPDFSTYADMGLWRQLESVAKNRWIGAYWQSMGLTVIPTISWGLAQSFEFCFSGVEANAPVAVGMVGCKKDKRRFLRGYNAMLDKLTPSTIICFGRPFPEMAGNIIPVDYLESRKAVR